jgi:hypothetical protein
MLPELHRAPFGTWLQVPVALHVSSVHSTPSEHPVLKQQSRHVSPQQLCPFGQPV